VRLLIGVGLALGLSPSLIGAEATGALRNFVACPIVRDTSTVPCWLAEYQGETYFLTLQTDVSAPVNPPWLGHKVMVEGRVALGKDRICGGVVLEPVRLSIAAELDSSCNTILPVEEKYNLRFEPPRPPGPSAGRLAFNTLPMPVKPSEIKRERKDYRLQYDFNGLINFKHPFALTPILDYAHAMKASRVEITGYRSGALLSDGTALQEQANLAQRRAEQIAELLKDAGLTQPRYEVRWHDAAPVANGDSDYLARRVEITLHP
jgi:hypothetical protein